MKRPCLDCGTVTAGQRCRDCAAAVDARRQRRQWYRFVYTTAEYRRARAAVRVRSGGRCEANVDGVRCAALAVECHHVRPLSACRSEQEAFALGTDPANLRDVCFGHNPRGGRISA